MVSFVLPFSSVKTSVPIDSGLDGNIRVANTSRSGGVISRYVPVNEYFPPSAPPWTHRNGPFGRRSMSQTESGTPLGSHQCMTCSALVQASNTILRGASKMRVITISRSVGVVTLNLPVFFRGDLFSSLRAPTFFLLLLHLFQVIVQAFKFAFPEAAKGLDPVSDILERNRNEGARTPLRIAPALYEACALKHV